MMEDDDTADRAHSLVTVCYSNNTLGFSCYEEISNTIFCFTAPVPADELEDSLTNLKARLMPTIFLLHPRLLCNKFFMDMLLASVAGAPDYYRYKVLKSSTWNDRTCNQLIHKSLSIRSAGSNTHLSNCQQVASAVDIDSEHCRQTLGALLAYMQESIFKLDAGSITVANLKMYAQEAFVQVDQKSLNALQIFAEEVHPNVMKGKGRSKEGFSLFGLFDRTNSLPGRFRLRDWMSRPFCSKEKILQRQKGVALVSRPCNRDFVVGICALLKHFHNLPRLLLRVKKVEAGCGDWCDILTSLMTAQTSSTSRRSTSRRSPATLRRTQPKLSTYATCLCNCVWPRCIDFRRPSRARSTCRRHVPREGWCSARAMTRLWTRCGRCFTIWRPTWCRRPTVCSRLSLYCR
jgi:DNA mismatch repair ATPase MutS